MCRNMLSQQRALAEMASLTTQSSTSSELNFTPNDPIPSLPYEIVAEIFAYVSPIEIVHICRLVNKEWKGFVDDPQFWQFQLRKGGNFSPKLLEPPSETIHWAKLYFYCVWKPNLIQSFVNDALSLTPWTISYAEWERFGRTKSQARLGKHHPSGRSESSEPNLDSDDSSHVPDSDSDDGSFRLNWGGGHKWSIEEGWMKEDDPKHDNRQLIKENDNYTKNYVTSFQWCCREQIINLSERGFSDSVMDTVQPSIHVSEWFCARWDCGSIFCICIELLSSEKEVLARYEDSIETDQWQGGELGWRKVEHVFQGLPGVRYIRFADAGKDKQFWAGHYGSKMAAARAVVRFS